LLLVICRSTIKIDKGKIRVMPLWRQSQHLTKKTFMLLENGIQLKPLPMTTAESNKPDCPTTAADEEDWIQPAT
jgi:hypothetical protein